MNDEQKLYRERFVKKLQGLLDGFEGDHIELLAWLYLFNDLDALPGDKDLSFMKRTYFKALADEASKLSQDNRRQVIADIFSGAAQNSVSTSDPTMAEFSNHSGRPNHNR